MIQQKQNKQTNNKKQSGAKRQGEQIQKITKQQLLNCQEQKRKQNWKSLTNHIGERCKKGKLTFCVRHLENKSERKFKQFVLSMRKAAKKTQLIVTRMCNDWLVDEYVPFHWREQNKNSRIERVIHIQPKRRRKRGRGNTHC